MTERLPYVQQNRTVAAGGGHDAQEWRWMHAGAAAPPGVCGAAELKVSAATGMQVTVAAGGAFVPDGSAPIAGMYHVFNDGPATLTLNASSPTQPRVDLVIAEVLDTAAGGASDTFRIRAVAGTPAASPSPPALPARSIELARVSVAAAAGSVVAGNITDRRTAGGAWAHARGAVLSVACGTWSSTGTETIAAATNVTIPTIVGRRYALCLQGVVFAEQVNSGVHLKGYWAGALHTYFLVAFSPRAASYWALNSVSKSATATATSTAVKASLQLTEGPGYVACDQLGGATFEVRDIGGGLL